MKVRIDLEVSPSELREFFGLPEVKPLQDEMLARLRERVEAGSEGLDAVAMMRPFLTPNLETADAMQKAFWNALAALGRGGREGSGSR